MIYGLFCQLFKSVLDSSYQNALYVGGISEISSLGKALTLPLLDFSSTQKANVKGSAVLENVWEYCLIAN